jgi:hypothetical protein
MGRGIPAVGWESRSARHTHGRSQMYGRAASRDATDGRTVGATPAVAARALLAGRTVRPCRSVAVVQQGPAGAGPRRLFCVLSGAC